MTTHTFLPSRGNVDLTTLAEALHHVPDVLGIADEATVRTVIVTNTAGAVYQYGTVLQPGTKASDNVILANGRLRLMSRQTHFSKIQSGEDLSAVLTQWPEVPLLETVPLEEHASVTRWSRNSSDLPTPLWAIELSQGGAFRFRSNPDLPEPFYDSETGFFADRLAVAAGKWLNDPRVGRVWEGVGAVRIALPDARALIRSADVRDSELHVEVAINSDSRFVCAAMLDHHVGRVDHVVPVTDAQVVIVSEEEILGYHVFLLDSTGEAYDELTSSTGLPALQKAGRSRREKRFTPTQQTMLDDAMNGETLHVELKEWIPPTGEDGKYRNLLKTVCAFANAEGGRLYIGISDEGDITGVEQALRKYYKELYRDDGHSARDEYARKLRQNIREGIDPPIEPEFVWVSYAAHHVLCVTVPASTTPHHYLMETREAFIRKNGTSRTASPLEVEEMLKLRRGQR
jgi:hypothetical protein